MNVFILNDNQSNFRLIKGALSQLGLTGVEVRNLGEVRGADLLIVDEAFFEPAENYFDYASRVIVLYSRPLKVKYDVLVKPFLPFELKTLISKQSDLPQQSKKRLSTPNYDGIDPRIFNQPPQYNDGLDEVERIKNELRELDELANHNQNAGGSVSPQVPQQVQQAAQQVAPQVQQVQPHAAQPQPQQPLINQAPINQTPINRAPINQAPINQASVQQAAPQPQQPQQPIDAINDISRLSALSRAVSPQNLEPSQLQDAAEELNEPLPSRRVVTDEIKAQIAQGIGEQVGKYLENSPHKWILDQLDVGVSVHFDPIEEEK